MAEYRPAGMSDEEEDSDIDIWGNRVVIRGGQKKNSKSQLTGKLAPSLSKPAQPSTSRGESSSKAEKIKEFWRKTKNDEIPKADNPKHKEIYQDFFLNVKQKNMNLQKNKNSQTLVQERGTEIRYAGEQFHKITVSDRPVIVVDTECAFDDMLGDLKFQKFFSFDIEGHEVRSYIGYTALIQIGTVDKDYLIDPFPIFFGVKTKLKTILEDATVLKIIFAARNEILWMYRDFEITINGIIDVQMMYKRYKGSKGFPSLKSVAQELFPHFALKKDETLSDWRRRPLKPTQIDYARMDVFILIRIWMNLSVKVTDNQLRTSLDDSFMLTVASRDFKTHPSAVDELRRENTKRAENRKIILNPDSLDYFELIHQWRNRFARWTEENPIDVLPIEAVVDLGNGAKTFNEHQILNLLKEKSSMHKMQMEIEARTIWKIFNEPNSFMSRINNTVCQDCQFVGHASVQCPFPKNSKSARNIEKIDAAYKTYKIVVVKRKNRTTNKQRR